MPKTDLTQFIKRQRSREAKYTAEFASALRVQYRSAARQYRLNQRFVLPTEPIEHVFTQLYNDILINEYNEAYKFYVKPYTKKTYNYEYDSKDILSGIAAILQSDFFFHINEFLRNFSNTYLIAKILKVGETTEKRIRYIVDMGISNGYSNAEIARSIEMEGRSEENISRARTISATEVSHAGNKARDLAINSSEFFYDKKWDGILDDRIRNSHKEMDSIGWVPFGYIYKVPRRDGGFDHMEHAHDEAGSAENLINCRCSMSYAVRVDSNGVPIMKS